MTVGLGWGTLTLALIVTFGAAAIRGLTGFGMAIILVPLLGMFIRPDEAVIIAILLQLFIGPVGFRTILADSHKSSALLIGGFALFATPFGLWALMHVAPATARMIIALIALGAFLLVITAHKVTRPAGPVLTASVGLLSGFLTGFAAMPGPPVIPYYLRDPFSSGVARASMMLIFFITAIAGTASAWLLGFITPRLATLSILLFPTVLLGNYLGGLWFGKISPLIWRSAVAALLGVAAVSACLRAFA